MPSRYLLLTCIALGVAAPRPLGAQGAREWVPPQPPCDIKPGHFRVNSAIVGNAGFRNWQESRPDSAKLLLRQAASLRPTQPRAYVALGQLYEQENKIDSAAAFLNQGAAAAGTDTAFAQLKKDALGESARIYARRLQAEPAVQKWQHTRFSRDSMQRLVGADSAVLARVQTSSASRRARGARLAPADQQAFARDSATRAQTA